MAEEKPIWEGECAGHRASFVVHRGMRHCGWLGHNPIIREGFLLRVFKDGQQIHVEKADEIVATALHEIAAERDALRERLAVVESEASRCVESLQSAVAALEPAHDAFYDALVLIRREEDPAFTGDVAAVLAGIVGSQLTPTVPAKLVEAVLELVRAERRSARIDRNRLAKLEATARAVIATHNEFRVSTEHSDAIWKLDELLNGTKDGESNG